MFSRVGTHVHLKLLGRKTGMGAYTEKPVVRITYTEMQTIGLKWGGGGWTLTWRWALTQETMIHTLYRKQPKEAEPCTKV